MSTGKHNTKSGPGRRHYCGQIGASINKPHHTEAGGKLMRKAAAEKIGVRNGLAVHGRKTGR